jgi:hypothetical protein
MRAEQQQSAIAGLDEVCRHIAETAAVIHGLF